MLALREVGCKFDSLAGHAKDLKLVETESLPSTGHLKEKSENKDQRLTKVARFYTNKG